MPGNWKNKNICPDHFPDFNLESSIIVILLLKMFIVKNLTDFRKTVETGVDPRLAPPFFKGLDPALNIDELLFRVSEAAQSVYSRVFTDRYIYVR